MQKDWDIDWLSVWIGVGGTLAALMLFIVGLIAFVVFKLSREAANSKWPDE